VSPHGLGQDIEQIAEREPVKLGLLAAAAIVGGFALGAAAIESQKRGWLPDYETHAAEQTLGEGLGAYLAANTGLVLGGEAIMQAIREMGREQFLRTVGWYTGGVIALKIVVDLLRKARTE
jgi:hypothetical protein